MAIHISTVEPTDITIVQKQITKFLLEFCASEADRAAKIHPNYRRLWDAIAAHVQAGGKRLRPYEVVVAYEAFGGTDHNGIIQVGAAWELLHIAMLMHDDIIDRDYARHGQLNVAGMYLEHYASINNETDRSHFANGSALLAGDLLVSAAYRLVLTSAFLPSQISQVCDQLYHAIYTVAGGELLDVESSIIETDITPLLVAENKTAYYSVIGPLLTGARLAGTYEISQTKLHNLGSVLGVGFQFVDDILGIFGEKAVTGKSTISDLEEGRRTFVVIEALARMTDENRQRAEVLLQQPSPESAHELRQLIDETDVQTVLTAKITGFHDAAMSLVAQLELPSVHRAVFERLVDMLLDRKT